MREAVLKKLAGEEFFTISEVAKEPGESMKGLHVKPVV